MSRRNKAQKTIKAPGAGPAPAGPIFSAGGKRLMGLGVGLIALGLGLLTLTDPMGRNWASVASPFSILGGYGLVFLGIFWPLDGGEETDLSGSPASPASPARP